ncbi:apolipoprotein N-acyltransferase [Desulfovibrio cuneatus]|uniref:apolipoprotein N-acyltransferase n=1 Tax=Desulfovibrio cuneatus TaxID=159728 RepID=UPI00041075DD|nr:apolipoprotein N-acyltransferase [Desulfovibrio cuneatus]
MKPPAPGCEKQLALAFSLLGAVGCFLGFANPVVHIPAAILLFPLSLFVLALRAPTAPVAFRRGWVLGLLGFAPCLYWLVYPIYQVGGLPLPLAVPCVVLVGSYLALYPALTALCLHRLQRRIPFGPAGLAIAFGLMYAGFEVIAGWLFSGFPWLNLATAFAPWNAFVQGAHILGSNGLTAWYATAAALLGVLCLPPAGDKKTALLLPLSLGVFLLAAMPLYGWQRLASAPAPQGRPFTVGLVQGNVDQNQKWLPQTKLAALEKHIALSRTMLQTQKATPGAPPIDLVLWAETAVPFVFAEEEYLAAVVRNIAREEGVSLGFGTLGCVSGPDDYCAQLSNRLQLLTPQGNDADFYDKMHLVPFGEYIPLALTFEFLRNILQGVDFAKGTRTAPLMLALPALPLGSGASQPQGNALPSGQGEKTEFNDKSVNAGDSGTAQPVYVALGALICYEVIFPQYARQRVAQGATVLITISNDAWFGPSSAPWQHLYLASMRAVEQMRPMVRATNTGLNAAIDSYGRITTPGVLFQEATTVVTVYPETATTWYLRAGLALEVLLACLSLAALAFAGLTRNPFRK